MSAPMSSSRAAAFAGPVHGYRTGQKTKSGSVYYAHIEMAFDDVEVGDIILHRRPLVVTCRTLLPNKQSNRYRGRGYNNNNRRGGWVLDCAAITKFGVQGLRILCNEAWRAEGQFGARSCLNAFLRVMHPQAYRFEDQPTEDLHASQWADFIRDDAFCELDEFPGLNFSKDLHLETILNFLHEPRVRRHEFPSDKVRVLGRMSRPELVEDVMRFKRENKSLFWKAKSMWGAQLQVVWREKRRHKEEEEEEQETSKAQEAVAFGTPEEADHLRDGHTQKKRQVSTHDSGYFSECNTEDKEADTTGSPQGGRQADEPLPTTKTTTANRPSSTVSTVESTSDNHGPKKHREPKNTSSWAQTAAPSPRRSSHKSSGSTKRTSRSFSDMARASPAPQGIESSDVSNGGSPPTETTTCSTALTSKPIAQQPSTNNKKPGRSDHRRRRQQGFRRNSRRSEPWSWKPASPTTNFPPRPKRTSGSSNKKNRQPYHRNSPTAGPPQQAGPQWNSNPEWRATQSGGR